MRALLSQTLALVITLGVADSLPAQITDYSLVKIETYVQDSDAGASSAPTWVLESRFEGQVNDFTAVDLVTLGNSAPMVGETWSGGITFDYDFTFASQALLDAAWPSAQSYAFDYSGGLLGSGSIAVNLSADAYPLFSAPPRLTDGSWSTAQALNPGSALSLSWEVPTWQNSADAAIILELWDGADHELIYTLAAGESSIVIPGGSLLPNSVYEGQLLFGQLVEGSMEGLGLAAFATEIHFTVSTVPEPQTVAVWLGLGVWGLVAARRRGFRLNV